MICLERFINVSSYFYYKNDRDNAEPWLILPLLGPGIRKEKLYLLTNQLCGKNKSRIYKISDLLIIENGKI